MKFSLHITRWLAKAGLMLSLTLAATLAPAQKITYFVNDPSGTPVMATDANGNVLWKESYRPYGEKLKNPAAAANNPIGFAGHPFDPATGLSYMGARYYDPVIGRFTGIDPAGFNPDNIHSFNRYAYANNNPYRFVDPDGHNPVDAIFLGYDLVRLGMAIYNGSGAGQAAADVAISAAAMAFVPVPGMGQVAKAMRAADHGVDVAKGGKLTAEQLQNIGRFEKKLPANAKDSLSVRPLPNEGVAVQATSPGRVPGSSAVYEKQIDATGKTIQYTKTTYDPAGSIVHVKDKLNGGVFP